MLRNHLLEAKNLDTALSSLVGPGKAGRVNQLLKTRHGWVDGMVDSPRNFLATLAPPIAGWHGTDSHSPYLAQLNSSVLVWDGSSELPYGFIHYSHNFLYY